MASFFLMLINMSITASYVIIAALAIRLLLQQAPKKYAYLLWSVVGFRLCCPVSIPSVVSLFNAWPFSMSGLLSGSNTTLHFIPTVASAINPELAIGIPLVDTFIKANLPGPFLIDGRNLFQVITYAGMILWILGILVLTITSTVTYLRLKCRVASAVRLNGNIRESDKIQSPFVLGLIKPTIYLPFGLSDLEKTYVLRHEQVHLARRDHLVKLLAYSLLVLYWFNPLVWLAYILMSRDMEMSCDEKVLSETGTGIVKAYSTSLLAFSANRRFPSASPLTFCETSIRERIKNILRFRPASKKTRLLAAGLLIAVILISIPNPAAYGRANDAAKLYGTYQSTRTIYTDPLADFAAIAYQPGYLTIVLTEDALNIKYSKQGGFTVMIKYRKAELTEEAYQASFHMAYAVPDISGYQERYQYILCHASEDLPGFRIYQMDGELWLAQFSMISANDAGDEKILIIHQIVRQDD